MCLIFEALYLFYYLFYFIWSADIDPRSCVCSAGVSLSSQTPRPGVTLACVLQRIFLPLRESSLSPFSHTALVKPRLLLSTFIRVLEAGPFAGVLCLELGLLVANWHQYPLHTAPSVRLSGKNSFHRVDDRAQITSGPGGPRGLGRGVA